MFELFLFFYVTVLNKEGEMWFLSSDPHFSKISGTLLENTKYNYGEKTKGHKTETTIKGEVKQRKRLVENYETMIHSFFF